MDFLSKLHTRSGQILRDAILRYWQRGAVLSRDRAETRVAPFASLSVPAWGSFQEPLPFPYSGQDLLLGLIRTRPSWASHKENYSPEAVSFKLAGPPFDAMPGTVLEFLITHPEPWVVCPYDIYAAELGEGDGRYCWSSIDLIEERITKAAGVVASLIPSDVMAESRLQEGLLLSYRAAPLRRHRHGIPLTEESPRPAAPAYDLRLRGSFSWAAKLDCAGEGELDVLSAAPSVEPSARPLPYNVAGSHPFRARAPINTNLDANLGAVYTPAMLASWVAREMCQYLQAEGAIRLLDPAAGDGSLLKAVAAALGESVELVGADLDRSALAQARADLPARTELYAVDSLAPKAGLSAAEAWRGLLGDRPVAGIIANPPWGADVNHSRSELKALGYELANGQFDSYDLFVELCLSIAPEGAVLAFILPDSILYPEHESLRRLLLSSARILSISRLGEGFFAGVFRGTVVVLARKGRPDAEHAISCMRLTKEWRQKILSGRETLERAQRELAHPVRQLRFEQDEQARFDIDVREQEEKVLVKMSEAKMPWTRWLASGRGIELSKHGKVIVCQQCGLASPLPRHDNLRFLCRACNGLSTDGAGQQQIVRTMQGPEPGWHPLIVGEDVDRYRCAPSRQVRLNVAGINYKTGETFAHRKLLIRKTGLGIKAAIDETGAYTNQVVFHYYVPPAVAAPPFLLDYLQGVLCSRVLLAYHLKRIGESEWRSHPYVTQQIVAELPIPDVREGSWEWRQAQAIADAVMPRRGVDSSSSQEDLNVDRLVAGLYGLTEADCEWVLEVLDQAEGLEPIRTLRLTERSALTPIRAA